jgi:choline-glycine betaine transporter
MHSATANGETSSLRPLVLFAPLIAFSALAAVSFLGRDTFVAVNTSIYGWILATFSNLFAITAFLLLVLCLAVVISPLGKVRIGGESATPMISRWNWFAITLSTTLAIGILFWGAAEPIYHLYDPGGLGYAPTSPQAARFAQVSLFMHWGFTPYAIYTVAGLAFALAHYNYGKAFSIASPIEVLLGRDLPRWVADVIDAIGLLALLFGLSSSLSTGVLSISGGIERLFAWGNPSGTYALITLAIVLAFFVSSASGLQRGIRILSDWNVKMLVVIAVAVFLAGPTLLLVSGAVQGLAAYGAEFVERSLVIGAFDNRDWANSWTVFYWANWFAWAPLAAMFLGRISRGYRVREFVLMNLVLAALFSLGWMTVFGGLSIQTELAQPGLLKNALDEAGPESVLYRILEVLPFPIVLATLAIVVISFLSYVTAADSNLDAIARLCQKTGLTDEASRPTILIKLTWAVLVGFVSWLMISLSGIDGIRMLSNLGGFPSLFIVIGFALSVVVMIVRSFRSEALAEAA